MAVDKGKATTTYNTDVHSISRRLNRIVNELVKSQSSGVSQTMPFDLTRVKAYINALLAYAEYITTEPLLDLPETAPEEMELPPHPVVPSMENDSVWDIVNLVAIARDELENSQSSRLGTNFVRFDYERLQATMRKALNLVAYIEAAEPLDLPESMPRDAMTGPGNRGV